MSIERTESASRQRVDLAIALDFESATKALDWVSRISETSCVLKVGLELFTASGPSVVEKLKSRGFRIFLDLKLHDIPNTVAKAVESASKLGVDFLTLHAGGGPSMLKAAADAAAKAQNPPRLLAVTVLTSFDAAEWNRLSQAISGHSSLQADVSRSAQNLAALARESGVGGIVCSAHELQALHAKYPDLYTMVPGIRPSGSDSGDQKRVVTPAEAKRLGASAIVVGRPITQASDPDRVIKEIQREIQ